MTPVELLEQQEQAPPQPAKWDRTKFIGGSDIAAVMGLSRWGTPLSLWAEKTGKLPADDLSNFEAAEIGTELEEYVARKFARKTGLQVRRRPEEYKHWDYPYMVCHIDRLILDGKGVLSCKTTSAWKLKEWEGSSIPDEYVLQLMWELGLTRRPVGWIAVLIGGQKYLYKEIAFDQELFDKMVESARVFWDEFVLKDVPPVAIAGDQETMGLLYPSSEERTVLFENERAQELNEFVQRRTDLIQVVKGTQERLDEIEAKIKQHLGSAGAGETDQFKFSWKSQSRTSVDAEKLKAEGLFEQYSKTASFRVLRTQRKAA